MKRGGVSLGFVPGNQQTTQTTPFPGAMKRGGVSLGFVPGNQ